MNLCSHRPTQPTDLVELTSVLRRHSSKLAALPASLPEPLLLSVARDLRAIEDPEQDEEDDEAQGRLAAPMMLVFSLMLGDGRAKTPEKEITVSESALFASIQSYQWAIEREIVTRITGKGGEKDEEILLQKISEARGHALHDE